VDVVISIHSWCCIRISNLISKMPLWEACVNGMHVFCLVVLINLRNAIGV